MFNGAEYVARMQELGSAHSESICSARRRNGYGLRMGRIGHAGQFPGTTDD
ncbi:hypothetical protein FTUN_3420 [Frigoriglobus tundricola]|uniref:Uncharacterized protein n=1 Tax=Frigoriglobus tundricola TaxID=2774151 RepID=A0A6M5YR92_9BACT|nr:hypothetical protein FTUN_3420 [Frigoriglobus tundricola]